MTIRMLESRPQSHVRVEEPSQVGECRRIAQRMAEAHDFDVTEVGRIGIVATELATNLVKHAGRGEVLIQALDDEFGTNIEFVSMDRGPGMHVEACMRDGHSTAGTAGTGLGAISRLSTFFDVYSEIGRGTVAVSRISRGSLSPDERSRRRAASMEFGAICVALAGEIECGDTWSIAERGGMVAIMMADGLGHGSLAAASSRGAAAAFAERPFEQPCEAMQHFHAKLSGGRGSAAAVALLDREKSTVTYAGVGNIAGSVVSADRSKGMVSHNGTLGVQLLRRQQFEYELAGDSKIVMHSDGVSARWSLNNYPGLFVRHSSIIAAVLYRDHARATDDATIIVARGRP